jgi:hypothetical protein
MRSVIAASAAAARRRAAGELEEVDCIGERDGRAGPALRAARFNGQGDARARWIGAGAVARSRIVKIKKGE